MTRDTATIVRRYFQRVPLLRGLLLNRRSCALHCDAEPQSGSPIFVTVHGTWAPLARWTQRESKLLMELARGWPAAGIYRFVWTGVNGARHRLSAAEILAEHLNGLSIQYPRANIVVISHSHGGNVVAWAATMLDCPVAAAVYLNTPFIQVLRQGAASQWFLRFTLSIALAPFVFQYLSKSYDSFLDKWLVTGPWSEVALILLNAALLGVIQLIVPPRIDQVRNRLVEVSNGTRRIMRELVIFVVGDEASAALGSIYFAQWMIRRLAIIVALGAISRPIFKGDADEVLGWIIVVLLTVVFVQFVLAMSAYGMVQGLICLDSSITVSPAPSGQADFATVRWSHNDRMRHSLIHESNDAVTTIVRWVALVLASL